MCKNPPKSFLNGFIGGEGGGRRKLVFAAVSFHADQVGRPSAPCEAAMNPSPHSKIFSPHFKDEQLCNMSALHGHGAFTRA